MFGLLGAPGFIAWWGLGPVLSVLSAFGFRVLGGFDIASFRGSLGLGVSDWEA